VNEPKLDKCLKDAEEQRKERWNNYCRIDGREIGTDGSCLNTKERADYVNKLLQDSKDDCFKQYPQK
jgi:hypothetical protein